MDLSTEHLVDAHDRIRSRYFVDGHEISGAEYAALEAAEIARIIDAENAA